MKKEQRRPLLTDRIAQVIIVVVFVSLFTPLAGRGAVHNTAYDGGVIIYPLMRVAYDRFLLLSILTASVVIVIHWIHVGAFGMPKYDNDTGAIVMILSILVCGLCGGVILSLLSLSQYIGETEQVAVEGRRYLAVSIIGENPDYFVHHYDYHIMQCRFGGIYCEYLTSAYAVRDMLVPEPTPQAYMIYDDILDQIRLLVDGEVLHTIPDVTADS